MDRARPMCLTPSSLMLAVCGVTPQFAVGSTCLPCRRLVDWLETASGEITIPGRHRGAACFSVSAIEVCRVFSTKCSSIMKTPNSDPLHASPLLSFHCDSLLYRPPSRFPLGLLLDDQQFESSLQHCTPLPRRRRPEFCRYNIYSVIRGIESLFRDPVGVVTVWAT